MSKKTQEDKTKKPSKKSEDVAPSEEKDSAAPADEQPQAETAAEELSLEQVLEKLQQAEEATDQAKDDLLRVQAEMQNLRRRTEQDVEKAHKYGQERFSNELLTVVDNLERSLAAASEQEDEVIKAIYDGVDLTLKSMTDCFSKFNIETVDPLGEPFDPQLHQAVSTQENPDVEPNTVTVVMQKGYTLHGRVLRPAMVMVSKAVSAEIDGQA